MQRSRWFLIGASLSTFMAHAADMPPQPDNTGVNTRDRSSQQLTPENQSESKSDVALAASVRRAVVAQPGISIDGQNIKIITQNNRVTLRGPVKSADERVAIEKTARQAAGSAAVDNQLEVK